MGVATVPPPEVSSVTLPTAVVAPPPPPAVAFVMPPPPTAPVVFPSTSAKCGNLTATIQSHHPSIHCAPIPISTMSMISIRANAVTAPVERPPLNITAVVDTSGSMNQEGKLEAVKAALRFVVASLGSEDFFSLVVFDETDRIVVNPIPVHYSNIAKLNHTINGITAQGRTNLSAGLRTAMQLQQAPRARSARVLPGSAPRPMVAAPPVPAHLLAAMTAATNTVAIPSFYVGATRSLSGTAASLHMEGTLPHFVSHIEITSPGQIGALQWKSGMPPMTVWPAGALTFTMVYAKPNYAPCVQTVDLKDGVSTYLTIAPQMTAPLTRSVVAPSVAYVMPPPTKVPVQLIMLFTDGEANRGISDANTLSRMASEWSASMCPDASLITFGFGMQHNAKLLRQLATDTQGTYYHVPNASSIPTLFGDCLGGFMSVVARKIKVRVESVSPYVTISEVQTSYRSTVDTRGRIEVSLKDIFADERRDMVVSVIVHPGVFGLDAALPLFRVTVVSSNSVGVPIAPLEMIATIPVVATPYMGVANTEVDEQIGRMAAAQAVEKATELASVGNFTEARYILRGARAKQCVTRSSFAHCVDEELEAVEGWMHASAWAASGCVAANALQAQHAQQRCNAPSASSAGYYQTAAKVAGAKRASAFAS